MPWFCVNQTPPEAAAIYQVSLFVGCTARSATRPEVNAGPTIRNDNAPTVPASKGGFSTGVVVFFCAKVALANKRENPRRSLIS